MKASCDDGHVDGDGADDWIQHLVGFAVQCENEGILGLAKATVEQTTSVTFRLASAVTSTACRIIVSAAGPFMIQQQLNQTEDDSSYVLPLYHEQKVDRTYSNKDVHNESPFLLKIAFQVTDIMLSTISPVLSNHSNGSRYIEYNGVGSSRLIEGNADDMFISRSCSWNSEDYFHDAYSCACDESTYSIYFDATASTCSESDSHDDTDTGSVDKSFDADESQSQSCIIESIPNIMVQQDTPSSCPTYYLDIPKQILSKMDVVDIEVMKGDNSKCDCFALNSDRNNEASVQAVLNMLIRHSLELLSENNVSLKWHPDDTTKKILQQYATSSNDDTEWMQTLEREVLKWTTQVDNTPMLKTQGIINMTPLELNDLLLDCTRTQEYNKFSLEKKDLCALIPKCGSGEAEAKIVEHIMKIPLVGTKVQTLSLTHSIPLHSHTDSADGADFIIVSHSVKKELNDAIPNPCFAVSTLRSISGTDKTELTSLTSISSLPIPKFLMHRAAFFGAEDFFCNLRKLTSS